MNSENNGYPDEQIICQDVMNEHISGAVKVVSLADLMSDLSKPPTARQESGLNLMAIDDEPMHINANTSHSDMNTTNQSSLEEFYEDKLDGFFQSKIMVAARRSEIDVEYAYQILKRTWFLLAPLDSFNRNNRVEDLEVLFSKNK